MYKIRFKTATTNEMKQKIYIGLTRKKKRINYFNPYCEDQFLFNLENGDFVSEIEKNNYYK